MNDIAFWLYASKATPRDETADAAVVSIVAVSRRRNADLGVTGALIFSGASFAQYIEGPPASICLLRESIQRDPRHDDVLTLADGTIACREFSGWSLAYSGRAGFVERAIERVREERSGKAGQAARDLKQMLLEFSWDS